MSQILLADMAWSKVPPPMLKQYGYIGVFLYVSRDASKCGTRPQVDAYHAAGEGVGWVFEDSAQRALGGYAAGLADGQFAASYLVAVGLPDGHPVYAAIDFAPTAAQMPAVLAYMDGFAVGLKPHYEGRAYGDKDVVDAMVAHGIPSDWQTAAWSNGIVDGKAAIYQRAHETTGMPGSYDEDVVLGSVAAVGLWMPDTAPAVTPVVNTAPATTPPAPAPAPAPSALTLQGARIMIVVRNTDNGRCYLAGVGVVFWLETVPQLDRWLALCGQTAPEPVTTVELADFVHTNPREEAA